MNIHLILVHFPIALLSLYAIFELLSLTPFGRNSKWFSYKALLLFCGFVFSIPTYIAGKYLESIYGEIRTIELHGLFATLSIMVFGLCAILYFARILEINKTITHARIQKIIYMIAKFANIRITIPLSIIGFVLLLITGAIGGGMAHGSNADPFTKFIFKLFEL